MKKGDLILSRDDENYIHKIMAVFGDIYLVSFSYQHDRGYLWYTKTELEKGFTLKESAPWEPALDKRYWFIRDYGGSNPDIQTDTWDNEKTDNYRLKTGNCFQTEEEAKEKLRLILNS